MVATASAAVLFVLILSGYASQMLKREVDLLDMLRTPLMLSFTRDSAFIPQRIGQNEPRLSPTNAPTRDETSAAVRLTHSWYFR
ncbi:hypothetical protein OSTOST_23370 [Ostertagia ostertagi]